MAPHPIPLPCALALLPPRHRDATTPSPCWAPHFMTQERLMFSNPTPSEPCLTPAATMSHDKLSVLTFRPCTAPLYCSLQPLLKMSLLSLGPSLLQFVSIVSLLLNHGNLIFEPACVFLPFPLLPLLFLMEINFSFKSLFAIWQLSPLQFNNYFYLSIASWQYHKYWAILILVLYLLYVTPLVCLSYSSFAPSSPFFSSWWQRDWELFTHTLVLRGSPSTSSRQPQTTHVFADSRIG